MSAGLFSSITGELSTAMMRRASGRSGNDIAQRPAPTSRTSPPAASASRARSCEIVTLAGGFSNNATGSTQGSSGACARICSGIAQASRACLQRAADAVLASGLGGKDLVGEPAQHLSAADLVLEQRHDTPHLAVELFPDGGHVLVLHGQPIADELSTVILDYRLVDAHVDQDTAHRDPELAEPVDEARNDGDRKRLGQGDKEEGRLLRIRE